MIETSLSHSEPVMLPDRSIGPVVRSVVAYSLLMAVMIASQVLLVFVPAVLFHCALRNRRRSAAWAAGLGGMALYALLSLGQPRPAELMHIAWMDIAFTALAVVLPSLVALPLVERGEPFGRVLMVLLIGSIAGLAVTELGFRSIASVSPFAQNMAQLEEQQKVILAEYRKQGLVVEGAEQWLAWTRMLMPATLISFLAVLFTLSLLMLGRLKVWRDYATAHGGGTMFSTYFFRNLSLPDWVLFAFILGGLTPLMSGPLQTVAANTLLVVVVLYLLQGLAIFRYILTAAGVNGAGAMLGWMLLLFLMLMGVGALLLAMAGLFDPFFDFRHFKKRKDDSHESHSD